MDDPVLPAETSVAPRHPLFASRSAVLQLSVADPLGLILVRGDASVAEFGGALEFALGLPAPVKPTMMNGVSPAVLCLGPTEWRIACDPKAAPGLARRIEALTGPWFASVEDVSDAFFVIDITGSHASNIVRKGCGLDLDAGLLAPGRCARTRFAGIVATIHPVRNGMSVG
ncbi:MAG: sarcosine oxidase subunit gamma, partial [Candidatus Binataceae bacterium]